MAISPTENTAFEDFLAKPRGDKHIRLNISRNTLLAFVFSILLHAVLLLFVVPKIEIEPTAPATTIEVSLAPKPTPPPPSEPPQELPPKIEPPKIEPPRPAPKVIAQKPTRKPSQSKKPDLKVPEVLTKPEPSPQQAPPPAADAPKDMAEYIAQRRNARAAEEADAAQQNAKAVLAENGPSESEKRDARIKNNLKVGTNGIFEVRRLESTSASFSFRGWTNNAANARLEYFEVEAKSGEDVRLLMVRRMVELVQKHYQGDFNFESHRLGRTIILSARIEDSAELEDVLMQEYFGRYYKTQ